ncbi:hypothetical protein P775_09575 [Puniceibacterium antarcticum]|uniref:Pilus assembly protein PilP n=1 Tax=Puniceibacterium antarcticum TaxID=1206336 RepID=A0A2G8RFR8_9RHOB|nr:amidophosphoribosyltransferase [Puniceibacterium antarcticum]PIL20379.1 hypothetical protein P775_09575 [Puniceibacterium antarcticum]
MAQTTPLPPGVAQEATEHTRANLDRVILLGIVGREGARRALLRLPGGRVARVSKGDRVGRQTVYAIDDTRIALGQNGRARWVSIPGR